MPRDDSHVSAAQLAARLHDRSAPALAADIAQMIKHGDLPAGTALPSVRELAAALRVSPATVSSAWQRLRARNMIAGRGRGGIRVSEVPGTPRPARYESEGDFGDEFPLDLRLAGPDPALLPPLAHYLTGLGEVCELNKYQRTPISPALRSALADRWPFPPRTMLVTNGGYEGLMLAIYTFVQVGDYVLVENPSTPRILDIVEHAGGRPVFLDRDDEGIKPDQLARGLELRPSVLIQQAGPQNPDGAAMTRKRRDVLADMIRGTDVLVFEDDGMGHLNPQPVTTISAALPEQAVLVRSYSKSHGPDLRIAVVDGPAAVVERIKSYRAYGSGWTSRILQDTLAAMLTDDACDVSIAEARDEYRRRQGELTGELTRLGVAHSAGLMSVWIPVFDERYALVTCAAHGVAISAGSRFQRPGDSPHIRAATSNLNPDKAARTAAVLALAASPKAARQPD